MADNKMELLLPIKAFVKAVVDTKNSETNSLIGAESAAGDNLYRAISAMIDAKVNALTRQINEQLPKLVTGAMADQSRRTPQR